MVRTRALVNCFTEIGEAAAKLTPGSDVVGDVPCARSSDANIVVHVYWALTWANW